MFKDVVDISVCASFEIVKKGINIILCFITCTCSS